MIKKLFAFLIIILIGCNIEVFAQDPHFSQFYANPIYTNPAFAGSNVCPRITTQYRNQWPGIPGAFVTYNASYDQHFKALSGGLGILAYNDVAGNGVLKSTQLSLAYSFKFDVSRKFSIRAALQGTYLQRSLDGTKLKYGDEIDPVYGFIYSSKDLKESKTINRPDFSAGFVGYSDKFWFGTAVHHIITPEIGFHGVDNKLPLKITLHTGFKIPTSGKFSNRGLKSKVPSISPNILYMQQGGFQSLNYGLYYNLQPVIVGLWFRQGFENPDALIFMMGLQQERFKFGYSYDITLSELKGNTYGSHELSFILNLPCPVKQKRIREIECPSF